MVMAPISKVVLGSIAFGAFWILAAFPSVPFLPVGRTAGSLLGAMLMVLFRVITPDHAFQAIDVPILGLLFGTMVVSIYLERADMFVYLGKMLSWKTMGPKDLLCRICLISAISSALFTNDTTCVVLTEFVLKIVSQQNLPPHPFLLALATSSNIGSAATPIGNPQNLVIAVQSRISFGSFLFGLLPAALVGVVANALMLLAMYWNLLSVQRKDEEEGATAEADSEEVFSHRFSPATLSHRFSPAILSRAESINSQEWNSNLESMPIHRSQSVNSHTNNTERLGTRSVSSEGEIQPSNEAVHPTTNPTSDTISPKQGIEEVVSSPVNVFVSATLEKLTKDKQSLLVIKWKRRMWKISVYLVTVGMLVSLLMGFNMPWTAITAALALVVLDFKDAIPSLEKVSYMLLIFFCGMFITVEGFNKTGIPSSFWELMEPYSKIDHIGGLAILAIIILFLSNVASNVPTVLLLGGRVAASAAAISPASEKKAWLILAWVSTVAGNLSLLGSAANLIVCEQARRAEDLGYNLKFWYHLKFGIPSTIIVTAIGLALIRG